MQRLRDLQVRGNPIPNLLLSDRELAQIPPVENMSAALKHPELVYRLHLNGLTELSDQINKFVNLQELRLTNNLLTKLPSQIGQLRKLKKLHLANNRLTHLPREIGQLSNLQELDLNLNHIRLVAK
jgi:Leucine-rich repeat (LRR) protein